VFECKQETVYAGDDDNSKLIVIPNYTLIPTFIPLDYPPLRGILIKNDTQLIVGCSKGYLYLMSI